MASPANNDIERYLDAVSNHIRDNVTIVTPDDLGQDALYHISVDPKVKMFRPEVSRRTAMKEDRSIARVSTAPTVAGCIQGYQADIYDFNTMHEKNYFHGGWYIYGFPFEYAVRPKKKLLSDAERTDEHWLVPYTNNHWEVQGVVYGKFFYGQVSMFWKDRVMYVTRECYVEVGRQGGIRLTKDLYLEQGYYRVKLTPTEFRTKWDKVKAESVESISVGEYREAKKVSADLLSYTELPPSAHW